MIILNGLKSLTIITKCSILDVAAVLDPPVVAIIEKLFMPQFLENFKENVGIMTSHLGKVSKTYDILFCL